jgi:xanthine dehydrogenase accessory factor
MFDEFFAKAYELQRSGTPFAIAVVVRAEKPSSGKPGDKAIITIDGTMYGWIGGSCAQPTVIREAVAALRRDEICMIRLSPNPQEQQQRDGLRDLPLGCFSGGTLEIFIEPQLPQPRLIVVGNLPVARALAELSKAMSYRTVLVDAEHKGGAPHYADEVLSDVSRLAEYVTPLTAIVVATHGQYDELAIEQALQTKAPYIGLVASGKRAAVVREYLAQQGWSEKQLQRLTAPAGIDIHARRGDEIALSIMAEIVQRRRNMENAWQLAAATEQAAPSSPEQVIDPVCGMNVTIANARFTYRHEDTTYYFCCPGCKTTFRKAPQQYLTAAALSMTR